MSAFNLEYEQRRLSESGILEKTQLGSVKDNIWALLAERTHNLNDFTLKVDLSSGVNTAVGYEHRENGDLSCSYAKSIEETEEVRIAERFQLENDGYEKAKKLFFDLPPYSTVLLLSPAPEGEIEGYPGYNLAYFYHILPGKEEDKRIIKSLSWINCFSKEEQAEILGALLGKENVEASESFILLSPAGVCEFTEDTQSLETIWKRIEEVYKKGRTRNFILPSFETIREYLLYGENIRKTKQKALSAMVEEIARMIVDGREEQELEEPWAIMLNLADQELFHKDITDERPVNEYVVLTRESELSQGEIFNYYQEYAYEPRTVVTQCGSSGGIGNKNLLNPQESLFTTRTFEVEKTESLETGTNTKERILCCSCPFCKKKVEAEIKGGRIFCPKCKKSAPWSDS